MPKKPKKPLKNARRHVVKLGDIAYGELGLSYSSMTKADVERIERMRRAMEWLDDDQAHVRSGIDDLLEAYDKRKDVKALVAGLRELIKGGPADPRRATG